MGWKGEKNSFAGKYTKHGKNWFQISDIGERVHSCHAVPSAAIFFSVKGFPGGSDGKESTCNAGDLSSILGSGRSPGERNGYPLQ